MFLKRLLVFYVFGYLVAILDTQYHLYDSIPVTILIIAVMLFNFTDWLTTYFYAKEFGIEDESNPLLKYLWTKSPAIAHFFKLVIVPLGLITIFIFVPYKSILIGLSILFICATINNIILYFGEKKYSSEILNLLHKHRF